MGQPKLISIVGPTAVGKTDIAIELALELGCEIISADARQFYREMSIGTAKPTPEQLSKVKHHFIDNLSVTDTYSAGIYEQEGIDFLTEYFKRRDTIVLVGGSGMYINALLFGFNPMPNVPMEVRHQLNKEFNDRGLKGLLEELNSRDPDYYEEVDRNNHARVIRALEVIRASGKPFSEFRRGSRKERVFDHITIGIHREREDLKNRINLRVDQMIQAGLIDEAHSLQEYRNKNALRTVGYKECFEHFDGKLGKSELAEEIKINTRQYAKRQMTWFKKHKEISWFDHREFDDLKRELALWLNT